MSGLNNIYAVPWERSSGRSIYSRPLRKPKAPLTERVEASVRRNSKARSVAAIAHDLRVSVDDVWGAIVENDALDVRYDWVQKNWQWSYKVILSEDTP